MLRLGPRLTEVRTLAFSPDNRYLLAVGVNPLLGGLLRFSRVALWDLSDPAAEPGAGINDGLDPIAGFFLPDGRALGVDNRGRWRACRVGGADALEAAYFPRRGRVEPAAVSPDGRWLALVGRGEVECWPLYRPPAPERPPWRVELDPGYEAVSVSFSPGSEVAAVVIRGERGSVPQSGIEIYELDTGGRVRWSGVEDAFCTRWSPDVGSLVAVRSDGFAVEDLYTRTLRASRTRPGPRLTDAAFYPSGRVFVTTDTAGQVQLWDTGEWGDRPRAADEARPPARELDWGIGSIQALAVSPDGTLGAVAGRRGEVVVWDADE
ncbi:MAG: sle [Gemmataceae bacterium]|nr:sle [Gemmataceae bacterium]